MITKTLSKFFSIPSNDHNVITIHACYVYFSSNHKVRRCQPSVPPLPNNATVDPSSPCDNHYGGQCRIVCSVGFEVIGSAKAMCNYDVMNDEIRWFWEHGQQPVCQPSKSVQHLSSQLKINTYINTKK